MSIEDCVDLLFNSVGGEASGWSTKHNGEGLYWFVGVFGDGEPILKRLRTFRDTNDYGGRKLVLRDVLAAEGDWGPSRQLSSPHDHGLWMQIPERTPPPSISVSIMNSVLDARHGVD